MAKGLLNIPFHRIDDHDFLEYINSDVDDKPREIVDMVYPDDTFYNNKDTNSKYYSERQFGCIVTPWSYLSFIHFNAQFE